MRKRARSNDRIPRFRFRGELLLDEGQLCADGVCIILMHALGPSPRSDFNGSFVRSHASSELDALLVQVKVLHW